MNVEEYWHRLHALGWFDAIRQHESATRTRLEENFAKDGELAFMNLAVYTFDTELIDPEGRAAGHGPYAQWLTELAQATNGIFIVSDVSDAYDYEAATASIEFTSNNRRYSTTVPFETDWFDYQVFDLANEALAESGTSLQFIALPAVDQTISLVLQTPTVYALAEAAELIPPQNAFIDESDDE